MCRLFGMSAGSEAVRATFWLLEASDSLEVQSHHNPDGTGLGTFDGDDTPVVRKAPIAAFSDTDFAREAREVRSPTFVAHVRHASTGALTMADTHPFEQRGRLFAHNGVLAGLPELEAHLGADMSLVHGDTDSERLFALITREIDRHEGDVAAGILAGVSWVAENLPVYALNLILTTDRELFALRYPAANTLYVLEREAGASDRRGALAHRSSLGMHVHSEAAAERPVVVAASEPMDDDRGWRALESGELLHVSPALEVRSRVALTRPPAHPLDLSTLGAAASASQAGGGTPQT